MAPKIRDLANVVIVAVHHVAHTESILTRNSNGDKPQWLVRLAAPILRIVALVELEDVG